LTERKKGRNKKKEDERAGEKIEKVMERLTNKERERVTYAERVKDSEIKIY
jgi:hypothetical protein